MIVHDQSIETQRKKNIPTPSTIIWYSTIIGKKVGTYKVCQNIPNTEHEGDSTENPHTINAVATAGSSNKNSYTTDEYRRAPSVSS